MVYGGHHDAWFHGGLDNASSVVNSLLIAKAHEDERLHAQAHVVFFSTTAEEYGYTNSYYDWCIGAWHAITQTHPDWAGKIAGMLNSELLGYKNGNLWMLASPEITPMLESQLAASDDLTLTNERHRQPAVIGQPWCWNDQWTFTAAGVPSVCFWSQDNDYSGVFKTTIYHTQYDTTSADRLRVPRRHHQVRVPGGQAVRPRPAAVHSRGALRRPGRRPGRPTCRRRRHHPDGLRGHGEVRRRLSATTTSRPLRAGSPPTPGAL